MLCFLKGMAFVPFLLVTWSSAAFIISYVVAVLSGHVNPFLPYISDTGTTPPESGIFGFMINFSAFLGAATMYTRYKIVEKQNQTSYISTPVFNLVSLVLGLVGCIGMGIVANFQELAVPVVHDGGALLAFVCGVVYTLLQSIISYKSCPQWNSLSTCHVRMAISAVSCAAVIPMIACASLISITKLEWNPKEKRILACDGSLQEAKERVKLVRTRRIQTEVLHEKGNLTAQQPSMYFTLEPLEGDLPPQTKH
ncbi:DNA damage-regulated autophagy modulator protein 1 isoform X2 [Camelus dromedarius]|uniref:DNA damage-regulated autophagy modulator protein 1 isoform X2 n=2 Tax=Camelus TaxID=9836 RepID=A0A8B8U466_CAMFR|nr:DNA damage-regulated autophagy modulator protein 1 isoform X2 [Camelus ferus]XP_045378448.1 DNA damage-regulated autophagy modulator protein 1 isoform X1 [Camelus bactrianus]